MKTQKLSIEQVDNGYIVRVIRTGLSTFKDPYEKPVMVFNSYEQLANYLAGKLNEANSR